MRRRRRARTPRTGRGACAPCGTTRRLQGGGAWVGAKMSGTRRGGRRARASSARRARVRRAEKTRRHGRSTATSIHAARIHGARDGGPVAFGLGSADGATQPPEAAMVLLNLRCATDSGRDRGNTYRRRPRRAKVAWLPPRTPSSSSRVSAMDRCVRVWRGGQRARRSRAGLAELCVFFLSREKMGVSLPSGGLNPGFWVRAGSRVRACVFMRFYARGSPMNR